MQKTTPILMFDGQAEQAMSLYTSLFANSEILSVVKYGDNAPGREGSVMHGTFTLAGQEYMALDSAVTHQFGFTPSVSIYIQCDSEEEIQTLYKKLSEGGKEMMPLNDYGLGKKFAWVADQFGLCWQLNLDQ